MPRDRVLIQQFSPCDSSAVSEIVVSRMEVESLAAPAEKEADTEEISDEGSVALGKMESENLSVEIAGRKRISSNRYVWIPKLLSMMFKNKHSLLVTIKQSLILIKTTTTA